MDLILLHVRDGVRLGRTLRDAMWLRRVVQLASVLALMVFATCSCDDQYLGVVDDTVTTTTDSYNEQVPEASNPLSSRTAPLFFHEEPHWDFVYNWAYTGFDIAAHYARATGHIAPAAACGSGCPAGTVCDTSIGRCSGYEGGCSATMIGHGMALTASHCTTDFTPTIIEFGYGSSWFTGATESWVRHRFESLYGTSTSASFTTLRTFACQTYIDYGVPGLDRDVALLTCSPKTINGRLVYPGDLWGFAYHDYQGNTTFDGNDVFMPTVAKKSLGYTYKSDLLAPSGQVRDNSDSCITTAPYNHCFEFDADAQDGSSGAPIFKAGNMGAQAYRMFGVLHGSSGLGLADPWSPSVYGYWGNVNLGAYLPGNNEIPTFLPNYDATNTHSPVYLSPWVGGSGGNSHYYLCPTGTEMIGVIGSTYPEGVMPVGNIGVVCANPWSSTSDRHLENMSVVVAGSWDTGFVTGTFPLNQYLNEHLLDASYFNEQQEFTLCNPGARVTSLSVYTDAIYLRKIQYVMCGSDANTADIGTQGGTYTVTSCPSGRKAFGLFARTGWLTDGLALVCY